MTKINYEEIIKKYPWIVEKKQKAILSPDIDGFLCGLLMSHYLDWDIVGFYNGKFLILKEGLSAKNCVFLDMEILRKDICLIGHHMNLHNISEPPKSYYKVMSRCINPNCIRGFDRAHNFARKYPLGTIHLLIYILETKYPNLVKIKKRGLASLFFADGVWKILFKYTNNVLDWFDYLHTGKESAWWIELKRTSVIDLIEGINILLKKFKKMEPNNKNWHGHIDISDFNKQKMLLRDLLKLLNKLTGWDYNLNKWDLNDVKKYQFTKEIYEGSKANKKFFEIWNKKLLSLAMTEGSTIQYTLEEPDKLP